MSLTPRLISLLLAGSTLPLSQAFFQGCATVIDGPKEDVKVRSRPAGAQVFIDGKPVGNTPTTVVVSRWGFHRLRIEMPGYKPFEIPLEKKWNDRAGDNVLIGGIWIIVDAVTGAIFSLDVPPSVRPQLLPPDLPDDSPKNGIQSFLFISTALKPDLAARRIGQLKRL